MKQCPVQRKRRVFGGSTNKDNAAILNMRQESILLGLVETVDFVDKQQRAFTKAAAFLSTGKDLAQISNTVKHR